MCAMLLMPPSMHIYLTQYMCKQTEPIWSSLENFLLQQKWRLGMVDILKKQTTKTNTVLEVALFLSFLGCRYSKFFLNLEILQIFTHPIKNLYIQQAESSIALYKQKKLHR